MKLRRLFIFIVLTVLHVAGGLAFAQQKLPTVRDMMEVLEEEHDVRFVYESELDLDVIHVGAKPEGRDLDRDLRKIFRGSGVEWKRNGKYVVLTKALPMNIDLEEKHDTLTASRITSDKFRQARTQTGLEAIDGRKFNQGYAVMSSPDLIKTLQNYPGVGSGTELVSGLYVHGGTGRDNLFLLDGVPLYQVSHLAGLFSSFNTDIIESVDFYRSGFPARFGGRLSSVVDVTTKDGDFNDYHGSFSIGLLDGRFQYEGPIIKGKTSFNVSLRRSWIDLVACPTLAIVNSMQEAQTDASYLFHDMNAKVTHRFSEDKSLSLSFFSGLDALKYGTDTPHWVRDFDRQTGEETLYHLNDRMNIGMKWGNMLTSLNWKSRVSDFLNYRVVLYHTGSNNRISNYVSREVWTPATGIYRSLTEGYTHVVLDDISLKADFVWEPHEKHILRFGGQYLFQLYRPGSACTEAEEPEIGESHLDSKDFSAGYYTHNPSLYLEDEMKLFSWLDLTLGLRYAMFVVNGKIWNGLEPRAAAKVSLGRKMALKASYAEMNQYVHGLASTAYDLPTNFWLPSTEKIKPMHSRQFAAEFLAGLPHGISLELGGFYRTLNHIYEYSGVNLFLPSVVDWEREFVEGKGLAYGAEASLGWSGGRIDANLHYTLSWSRRYFEDFYYDWYYDRNDARHKITADFSYRINDGIDLYAVWNYHTGSRISVSDLVLGRDDAFGEFPDRFFTCPNNIKLPDYHRLDVGANFRKTTKRGNERIWNVSLYNAYCRMNPFIVVDYYEDDSGAQFGKVTAVFPIIPSFSYTLKF